MDQLPEQERKNRLSYFSWLPQDLTLRYLPFWIREVNSGHWDQPLRILERRSAKIGEDGYLITTHDHRRYPMDSSEKNERLNSRMGTTLEAHILPNESVLVRTGELLTEEEIRPLWKARRLVWTNRRSELYSFHLYIIPHQLEIFNGEGELKLTVPIPAEFKHGAISLVDQTLYHLENGILLAWQPWESRVWRPSPLACLIPISEFSHLITDHRRYWFQLLENPLLECSHLLEIYNLEGQVINQLPLFTPSPSPEEVLSRQYIVHLMPNAISIFSRRHPFDPDRSPLQSMFLVYSPDGLFHLYYPDLQRHLIIGLA